VFATKSDLQKLSEVGEVHLRHTITVFISNFFKQQYSDSQKVKQLQY